MAVEDSAVKRCTKCGETKPATTEFFKPQKGGKYGLRGCCRSCFVAVYLNARYVSDPEYRAKRLAAEKARYESKRDEIKERVRAYRSVNSERISETRRANYANNKERERILRRSRYLLHGNRIRQARAEYRAKYPDRVKQGKLKDYLANKPRCIASNAKRRAQTVRATPPWADQKKIAAMYADADRVTKETGIVHHVDHIVPLRGENVCGLHVHQNLRVIPARENASKYNKLLEELCT